MITKEKLPCVTYPTKGNKEGSAFVQYQIFDANNTAMLIPKKEYRGKIDLEWFAFKLRHILQSIQTSKENVSYLNKDLVEPFEIEIPEKEVQLRELTPIKKLRKLRGDLSTAIDKIDDILEKAIIYDEET